MKLAAQHPSYYDVQKLGIPINDLDCIATIGTFSATLIWLAFPRQGIFLRRQEILDYIALWRYIGYLTGTPTESFETPEKAKRVMESLLMNEIDPTETSKILANNVIKSLAGQPPQFASTAFLEASSRWLNGNELCDALGLGRPGWYHWSLMAGQCLFFMAICYTYRMVPYLDRQKITVSRAPHCSHPPSMQCSKKIADAACSGAPQSLLGRHRRWQERSARRNNLRLQIYPRPPQNDADGRGREVWDQAVGDRAEESTDVGFGGGVCEYCGGGGVSGCEWVGGAFGGVGGRRGGEREGERGRGRGGGGCGSDDVGVEVQHREEGRRVGGRERRMDDEPLTGGSGCSR